MFQRWAFDFSTLIFLIHKSIVGHFSVLLVSYLPIEPSVLNKCQNLQQVRHNYQTVSKYLILLNPLSLAVTVI